ncbi:MAG TPA: DUF2156 domain-containing protein [Thermoanaerobaculia bacterium]|nr:DUF2156 domain-containing protein [Thermoanaerobaculia bacterium]HUM28857.1 DUF2156 domain-containing protein [Thermoanaerobaculia bacterium]HXK67209.1 DUF2156 domain-containing protein [Thermoanaerobaculia bacterium]
MAVYREALSPITFEDREFLHPVLRSLPEGISEFSFANIYLFREKYGYQWSMSEDGVLLFTGIDSSGPFCMLPLALPSEKKIHELLSRYRMIKCVNESQAEDLKELGFSIIDDRDNYDYLYSRNDLAELPGRKFHKKKNLIRGFVHRYTYEARPLLEDYTADAMEILRDWRSQRDEPGDFKAAQEALERMEILQLCGLIYYVDGSPAAYLLGEEMARGTMFAVHFEKAIAEYKGLYQFVNQSFASILPDKYELINREQDLGIEGLRKTKLSYNPSGFVRKYRAYRP